MEKTKIEKMRDIKVKLEDIHNSQASLIEKMATVIVELFNTPDSDLEKKINEIHSNASANAEITATMVEDYEIKINKEANK